MRRIVAGIDLGGTAINYTLLDAQSGEFLVPGLAEQPARAQEGADVCLGEIAAGLTRIAGAYGVDPQSILAVGLDTPGPASAAGVLSARGSTNFAHPSWRGFDLRGGLEERLKRPVTYLNDGNAAALWGHMALFGSAPGTSVSAIIGTGLGGGLVVDGRVVEGRNGFGGEVGHVLIPCEAIPALDGLRPPCNCGRDGDLESVCSLTAIERTLLPMFLARALGLFFDQITNLLDPDAFLIGGGALEVSAELRAWWVTMVRAGMGGQREEQQPRIEIMPNGDAAGARGAALQALRGLE